MPRLYRPTTDDAAAMGGAVSLLGRPVAVLRADQGALAARTDAPWGPVVELAQGVWERWPERAHAILRRRVFVDAERDVDAASTPVVAKKRTVLAGAGGAEVVDLGPAAAAARARLVPVRLGDGTLDEVALACRREAAALASGPRRALSDRPVVAALLVGDQVVLAARNQAGRNRCLHAEVALVQLWWERQGQLPAGATVATSLQPCRMCAAVLLAAASTPDRLRVVYAEADPGRFARSTALARGRLERSVE